MQNVLFSLLFLMICSWPLSARAADLIHDAVEAFMFKQGAPAK